MKHEKDVSFEGKQCWAYFQTTPTTLSTYPKTTLKVNSGNFGPILMKIGEVL